MSETGIAKSLKDSVVGGRKILIPVAIAAIVAVGYTTLSSEDPPANPSTVTKGPMDGTPTLQGGATLSPAYAQELGRADEQRIDEARQTGGSAIPTLRPGTQEQLAPVPLLDPVVDETPVVETPKVDAAPIVLNVPPPPPVPIVTAPPAAMSQSSPESLDSLKTYMSSLRRANPVAEVTTYATIEDNAQQPSAQQTAPAAAPSAAAEAESKIKLPLAGKILYAQMVSRADSDAPGPVLAKIVQGDYAGATLIGSFQKAENALVISFDRMTVENTRDGEEINETIAIEAIAVSTDYIGTALATHVDRHLFQKIGIGFLAGFAEGFGDAISQKGQTTISGTTGTITTSTGDLSTKEELYSAGGKAVSNTGSILMDEFGRRPTTVRVESGTPIGVLFL
jgi:Type IV secretory pathway, VirB10 components